MVAHVVESVPHHPPYHNFQFFVSGGAGQAFVAGQFVAQHGYGSGTTANPYSPYSSSTPSGYGTTSNPYGSGSYGTAPPSPYSNPVASTGPSSTSPGSYNSATPSSYSSTPGGTTPNPYGSYGTAAASTPAAIARRPVSGLSVQSLRSVIVACRFSIRRPGRRMATASAASAGIRHVRATVAHCLQAVHRPAIQLRKAAMERRRGTSAGRTPVWWHDSGIQLWCEPCGKL